MSDEENRSLTFGEIVPASFLQILDLTNRKHVVQAKQGVKFSSEPTPSKVFVDLGSGIGRACITATLSPLKFSKVWGIEIMDALNAEAASILEKFMLIIENPTSHGCKESASNANAEKLNSQSTILSSLIDALTYLPGMTCSIDRAVNLVCKSIGHKVYRAQLKQYRTFANFLAKHNGSILSGPRSSNLLKLHVDLENATLSLTTQSSELVGDDNAHDSDFESDDNKDDDDEEKDQSSSHPMIRRSPMHLSEQQVQELLPLPEIIFQKGDIFEVEWWREADVAYAASLLFTPTMMERLAEQVLLMKSGSWFISLRPLSPRVPSHRLKLRSESFFRMSWQMAKVFVYEIVDDE